MKQETAAYLRKAKNCLEGARKIAEAGVPDVAAREAEAYEFKSSADNGIEPEETISAGDALSAIGTAARFIQLISILVP